MAPTIDHVVVLMLENRSFDNLLGYLRHPDPRFEGLVGRAVANLDGDGNPVPATDDGVPFDIDPDHSHAGALHQMGPPDAPNSGFVTCHEAVVREEGEAEWKGRLIMRCLDPQVHSPAIATLALEFAVCDHWFSSVPGETWPNRNFAHAATSDGTVDIEAGLYYDRTIFELLEDAGKRWRIYFDGPPQVWAYRRLWSKRSMWDFLLRRKAKRHGNWFAMDRFAEHVAACDLPAYTFIEPAHNTIHSPPEAPRPTNSQHPHNNLDAPDDFARGDRLVAQVYEELRANRDLFERTLLVITYDEHGGHYDHVAPPPAVPPGDPSNRRVSRWIGRFVRRWVDRRKGRPRTTPFPFDRYGVRVPAILVSPGIPPASLLRETFDHSSIPATLRALFAPDAEPLTERDRVANTFQHVVPDPGSGRDTAEHPLPDLSGPATATIAVDVPSALRLRAAAAAGRPAVPDGLDRQMEELADTVERKLRPTVAVTKPARRIRAVTRSRALTRSRSATLGGPNAGAPVAVDAEARSVELFLASDH